MPVRNRKNPEDSFVLNWNDQMHDVFIDALEKQHNLGKRSDTGFIPEAWVYCVAEVQNVYTGKGIILVEKLKNKLDHVCCILYSHIFTNLRSGKNDGMTGNGWGSSQE